MASCQLPDNRHYSESSADLVTVITLPFDSAPKGQQRQAEQDWPGDPQKCLEEGAPGRQSHLTVGEGDRRSEGIQQACPIRGWFWRPGEADEVESHCEQSSHDDEPD